MAENKSENGGEFSPQPQFELPGSPPEVKEQGQESQAERAVEKRQVTEKTPAKQAPQFPQQVPAQPPPQQQTQDPVQGSSSQSAGLTAADVDLIEKQWVEKAKTIVSATHDDPYKQKNEMSKFKADYIKRRFNKTIPADDTAKS
jgi:hypothetical protein